MGSDRGGGHWWDSGPNVLLRHGTSSFVIERSRGFLCPPADPSAYALEVLEDYIPRPRWDAPLIELVMNNAVQPRSSLNGMQSCLFFMLGSEGAEGYARSFALHGGEIAYDVWRAACQYLAPGATATEMAGAPPLRPRWEGADPVLIEVEVPKARCVWSEDPEMAARRLTDLWMRGARTNGLSLEDFLDSVMSRVEVKITGPVSLDNANIISLERTDRREFEALLRSP